MEEYLSCHERMRREVLAWIDNYTESMQKILDQHKIAQVIFTLSENYWQITMEALSTLQTHNEKMLNTLINQGVITYQEGKDVLQEWMSQTRKAREQFQKAMEDNWKIPGIIFGVTTKSDK